MIFYYQFEYQAQGKIDYEINHKYQINLLSQR